MPAAKSAAGPAFCGIDDEAAIRSPRLDDVVLPQAIMQERGDHALPLHAEAIDTVQGCSREGIGPNEWQSAPRRHNTDWQKLAGHVGTDSGAVCWLKMEGPNDRALLDDLGDSEGTSSRRQRRSFLATLDLRPKMGRVARRGRAPSDLSNAPRLERGPGSAGARVNA
jgi:hypothetical protein